MCIHPISQYVVSTCLTGARFSHDAYRSSKHISGHVSSLRVPIHHNVRARALLVEGGDLRDTIASALSNLVTVVSTKGYIKLDVNVVAALALSSQLAAGGLDEGESATVMVWGVVATSHEYDHIGTSCVELRGHGLRSSEGGEGAQGDGVADTERHD